MRTLTRIYDIGALICFLTMTGCVLLEVVTRNVLQIPTTWAEELSRFMCVWTVFLGAAAAWSRGTHIVINVLPYRLKGLPKKILIVFTHILSAIFLVSVWVGVIVIMYEQYEAKTTALEISISWFYLGLFLGATGMVIFHFYQTVRIICGIDEAEGPTGPLGDSC